MAKTIDRLPEAGRELDDDPDRQRSGRCGRVRRG
jgi:hypothetical protein